MTAIRIVDDHIELANIGVNTHAQIDTGLTKLAGIEAGATADQTKADIDGLGLSHDSLVDVSANDHHNELHSIVSHNDTSATGAQLDTLTDNSIADTLHRHSELVASDGSPDPALGIDASGLLIAYGYAIKRNVDNGAFNVYGGSSAQTGAVLAISGKTRTSHLGGIEFWANTAEAHVGARDHQIVFGHYNGVGTYTTRFMIDKDGHCGVGTITPATSALLDLTSTTGALLLPRMTTVQKNALTAVNGILVYDSTLNKFQGYENGSWTNLI